MKKLYVIGLGPGRMPRIITPQAAQATGREPRWSCGYTAYLDLIRAQFQGKEVISTPMTQEIERCRMALEAGGPGKDHAAMVCSGDAGVYGMAGLHATRWPRSTRPMEIQVVPGITAACGGAAVLGAPLTHDFAVISLSDLLTPWEKIETRLDRGGPGGFRALPLQPRPASSGPTTCSGPATSC